MGVSTIAKPAQARQADELSVFTIGPRNAMADLQPDSVGLISAVRDMGALAPRGRLKTPRSGWCDRVNNHLCAVEVGAACLRGCAPWGDGVAA